MVSDTEPAPSVTLRRLAVVLAIAVVAGCTRAPETTTTYWRLVDTEALEGSPADPPTPATRTEGGGHARGPARGVIDDDMRYTFARPPTRLVYRDQYCQVPADGLITRSVPLPPAFKTCKTLLMQVAMTSKESRDMLWVVGTCNGPPAQRRVDFTARAPAGFHGQTIDVWVNARPAPPGGVRQRRFTLEQVPPRARLALSYGIESAGWQPESAPVTFSVRVDGVAEPLLTAALDPARHAEQRHWFDATVPLDGFAGRRIMVTLETATAGDPSAPSVPLWGNPTILVDGPTPATRPWNVLLISLDTLRARSLGAYGRARPTSPVLDALAKESTLFETVVAQSTLTPISNMSLFTSLYPRQHGVTDLRKPADPERVPTLPELLRQAGYATGAVTEDGLLQPALGFERGFDEYRENKSADVGSTVGQIERTFEDARRWMGAHRTRPFFLFVQTYQVHAPYTPPPAERGRFGPADAEGLDADRDRYEEEIVYADDWLGRLWSGVRELGLDERTLLIVTSDHGEEFGEHGALDHGAQLYDETLLVPLVMRAPGLVTAGLRVHEPVAVIDVVPTILELLRLPPLANAQGLSLASLWAPEAEAAARTREALRSRFIFGEAWAATRKRVDGTLDPDWTAPLYSLRTPDLKLIAAPAVADKRPTPHLEAYDLASDPNEQRPLADLDANRLHAARSALERYIETAAPPTTPDAAAPAEGVTDPATIEKLRALGYLR